MSLPRLGFLLAGLTFLAVMVVHLRAEQHRIAARVLKLESDWIRLRSEWWSLQTRSTRVRSPRRVRERVDRLMRQIDGLEALAPPSTRIRLSTHRP